MTANTTNRKPIRSGNSAPSIISSDVTIKGDIITIGEIQLDGNIEGDIHSAALIVGEHGSVNGIITAEDVIIKGAVEGQIKGRSIRIEKTARIKGDLFHETLSVEAGAFIEGNLTHQTNMITDKAIQDKTTQAKGSSLKVSDLKAVPNN